MRYLGLDLGTKTLGIALSDINNVMAFPDRVLTYKEGNFNDLEDYLNKIIDEKKITDIVLGYPKNMDNSQGFASQRSLDFQKFLQKFKVKIHLEDERLSTVEALNILKSTGNKKIKEKNIVDAVAASIILERYLKGKKDE